MDKMFSNMGSATGMAGRRPHLALRGPWLLVVATVLLAAPMGATPAGAQEQILFTAVHNAQQLLLQKIRNERVRLDVAIWLLADREISHAIVARHQAGVPVRVLGDRAAIFESDPNTRAEFQFLASNGVPIRLRYHPTYFPEIMHWKAGIFVGQNTVEFGSANWTGFALAPWSSTDFSDETAMFTDDPTIFRAFLTMFDQMWADTTSFLDWPAAYTRETGQSWTTPMTISRGRLEPDYPTHVPGMVWSQGPDLVRAMTTEIDRETRGIDVVSYRLTVPELSDALIRRFRAGVPVRVLIEPTQYRNPGFPEYWLVGAMADRLWAAGVPVKERAHNGLMHIKTLITSNVAMIASSNFTRFWQRDHNYFVSASAKPTLYLAAKDRFEAMWNDTTNYRAFQPLRPDAPALQSPATGAAGVPMPSRLVWRRAPWAVAFDVYIGPAPTSLSFAGRVNAVLSEDPPSTYSFTPAQPLQPSSRYYWQVVSRTLATDHDPRLVASSEIWTFTTGASTGTPPPPSTCVGPAPGPDWACSNGAWIPPGGWTAPPPTPPLVPQPPPSTPPSSGSNCTTVQPAPDWLCLNGGWVPPDFPIGPTTGDVVVQPAPVPQSGTCTTIQPGPSWLCLNGGWVPPGFPIGPTTGDVVAQPAPVPQSGNCTTIQPGPSWLCLNGGWVPPDWPGATAVSAPASPAPSSGCGGLPDPFVSIGGGVCISGGWVPRTHPLAGR